MSRMPGERCSDITPGATGAVQRFCFNTIDERKPGNQGAVGTFGKGFFREKPSSPGKGCNLHRLHGCRRAGFGRRQKKLAVVKLLELSHY